MDKSKNQYHFMLNIQGSNFGASNFCLMPFLNIVQGNVLPVQVTRKSGLFCTYDFSELMKSKEDIPLKMIAFLEGFMSSHELFVWARPGALASLQSYMFKTETFELLTKVMPLGNFLDYRTILYLHTHLEDSKPNTEGYNTSQDWSYYQVCRLLKICPIDTLFTVAHNVLKSRIVPTTNTQQSTPTS